MREFIVKFEGLTFYFENEKKKNKFENNVKLYCVKERMKNFYKYGIRNSFEMYYSISYYRKIQKSDKFKIIVDKYNKEIDNKTIIYNRLEVV